MLFTKSSALELSSRWVSRKISWRHRSRKTLSISKKRLCTSTSSSRPLRRLNSFRFNLISLLWSDQRRISRVMQRMAWMRSLSLKYCDTSIRCGVCTKAVKYTGSGGSSAPLSATVNTYTSGGVGMVAAGASAKKSGARSECASSSLGPASARSASAPMSELVMETWRSISAVEVAPPAPSSRYTAMAMPGGGGSKASPRAATGCSWNLHSLGFLAVRCDADTLSGSADEFLARLALRPANRSDAGVQTMPLSTVSFQSAELRTTWMARQLSGTSSMPSHLAAR
mmetsp:Transcript_1520/g.3769  ORF Transcript_1520/g.3769 Transcript_1520/m.3769 type:complete len:284 (+) Transcript_1520:282-1133(+)